MTCAAGTFQPLAGKAACSRCLAGQYGGYEGSDTESTCIDCDAGRYADLDAADACKSCPAGKYQPKPGHLACNVCAGGQVQPDAATTTCVKCLKGQFASERGSTACEICPVSKYQPLAGQPICKSCSIEGMTATGASSCGAEGDRSCPAGQAFLPAGSACANCIAGKFKSGAGTDPCESCACGTFTAASGATACDSSCPAGKYGNSSTGVCEACPDKHFCINSEKRPYANATTCVPGEHEAAAPSASSDRACAACADGRFSNVLNAESCEVCAPCESGARIGCGGPSPGYCGTCPASKFYAGAGEECRLCPAGFWCLGGRRRPCGNAGVFCPEGSSEPTAVDAHSCTVDRPSAVGCTAVDDLRRLQQAQLGGMVAQRACSPGFFCEAGVMKPCERGYSCSGGRRTRCNEAMYCPDPQMPSAISCPLGSKCTAGGEVGSCAGNQISLDGDCVRCGDGRFKLSATACEQCPDSDGVQCLGGHAVVRERFYCHSCRQAGGAPLGPALELLRCRQEGVCRTAWNERNNTVTTTCADGYDGPLCAACAPGHGRAGVGCVPCPESQATMDVLLLLAVVAAVGALLFVTKSSLNPDFETATMTILRIFVTYVCMSGMLNNFDLDWGSTLRALFGMQRAVGGGAPPLLGCIGFSFVTQTAMLLALPLVLPLVPFLLLSGWYLLKLCRGQRHQTIFGVDKEHFYANSLLNLSYLAWPAVVGAALSVFDCGIAVGGERYLSSDSSVACDSDAGFGSLRIAAAIACATVIPAFPIGVLRLLRAHADELQTNDYFRSRYFFLYGGFKPEFYWWDVLVMARKFALIAVSAWLGDDTHGYQVWAGLIVLQVSFVLQLHFSPYYNTREDRLETLSLGATTVSLVLGQGLLLGGMSAAQQAVVRTAIGAINVVVICVFIWHLYRELKASAAKSDAPSDDKPMTHTNPMFRGRAPRVAAKQDDGWSKQTDDSGNAFFVNETTGESAWERPAAAAAANKKAAAPQPLRALRDAAHSVRALLRSGGRRGQAPPGPEQQAEQLSTDVDHSTTEGWEAVQDENGDTYWWHTATGATSWVPPVSPGAGAGDGSSEDGDGGDTVPEMTAHGGNAGGSAGLRRVPTDLALGGARKESVL